MKKFLQDESGSYLIVEASIVYPITFFVLLFLIYVGNRYYMRSAIDAIAHQAAMVGSYYANDPLYETAKGGGGFPSSDIDGKPYHYLLSNGNNSVAKATEVANKRLGQLASGYFTGMDPNPSVTAQFDYKAIKNTFTVTINYSIKFPISFIFTDERFEQNYIASAAVSASDGHDMIDLVNMAMDYMERATGHDLLGTISAKVGDWLG